MWLILVLNIRTIYHILKNSVPCVFLKINMQPYHTTFNSFRNYKKWKMHFQIESYEFQLSVPLPLVILSHVWAHQVTGKVKWKEAKRTLKWNVILHSTGLHLFQVFIIGIKYYFHSGKSEPITTGIEPLSVKTLKTKLPIPK